MPFCFGQGGDSFLFLAGCCGLGVVEWNVLAWNIRNTPVKEEGSNLKSEQEFLSKCDIVHGRCKNSGKCKKSISMAENHAT